MHFWFGTDKTQPLAKASLWFSAKPEVDEDDSEEIEEGSDIEAEIVEDEDGESEIEFVSDEEDGEIEIDEDGEEELEEEK